MSYEFLVPLRQLCFSKDDEKGKILCRVAQEVYKNKLQRETKRAAKRELKKGAAQEVATLKGLIRLASFKTSIALLIVLRLSTK
jgi:hypothetical protein